MKMVKKTNKEKLVQAIKDGARSRQEIAKKLRIGSVNKDKLLDLSHTLEELKKHGIIVYMKGFGWEIASLDLDEVEPEDIAIEVDDESDFKAYAPCQEKTDVMVKFTESELMDALRALKQMKAQAIGISLKEI